MKAPSPGIWSGSGLAAALVALCLALTGCQSASAEASGGSGASGREQVAVAPATLPAVLEVYPADGATGVAPNVPVTVRASSGTMGTVTLAEARGDRVAGRTGSDGTWRTSELLHPSTAYTLTIASPGPGGTVSTTVSNFETLRPKVTATYALLPGGGTVGVGMPVIVRFDSAVTSRARRAEVEKRVRVTTVPDQQGSWGWFDDRQLMWRPRSYWLPGTKVTVRATLHGVRTGDDKWVAGDDGVSFMVGPSMVSSVDMRRHRLTVRRNGTVIRTFPVSTGKPGLLTETRSGVKIILERSSVVVMDSATVGIPKGEPGYYKMPVRWNLRLTWTGEYIHSAPWSVGVQGFQNVSHGCTNMAPADAAWMFENSRMGDVVRFTGSSRAFLPSEGLGVWVYDYAGWRARSAIG